MTKPLILHVEDTLSIYKMVAHKLKKSGYRIEHRENGKDGIDAIKELVPDLVILDVMLPSMNGFEILRQVREDPALDGVKVLMLTSKSRSDDLERGFSLEVDDYLAKPFKPQELLLRVKKILAE